MKRGSVWWVNWGRSTGSEIRKSRPAIVVSNDASNKKLNRMQVVPLTSRIKKPYPGEAMIEHPPLKKGRALTHQIMTVDKSRLTKKVTDLSSDEMQRVDQALRQQLDL